MLSFSVNFFKLSFSLLFLCVCSHVMFVFFISLQNVLPLNIVVVNIPFSLEGIGTLV
jgi:hypothetical protein